jgi:hypothetical protein
MGEGEEGSMISMSKASVRNKDEGHYWPLLWAYALELNLHITSFKLVVY